MSAFVEIEFDNADGRFPTSEFSIDWNIGHTSAY